MNQHAKIRFQILSIAIIGGLALLFYLILNLILALNNAQRLDTLQSHHYPILEELRALKQELASVRETQAAAVGLGDTLLLEDSLRLGDGILRRLHGLRQREVHLAQQARLFSQLVERYLQTGAQLAQTLMQAPETISVYQSAMEGTVMDYNQAKQALDQLMALRQEQYQELMGQTRQAAYRANQWAAGLGALVMLILGVLASAVARRVVRDISASDRLKDEFLGTISHELRTPMNGIVGAHSLLADTTLNESQQEWLAVARDSTGNMMKIIDDVLQYSELAAGRAQPIREPFTLRTCVVPLVQQIRQDCAAKGLLFECRIGPVLDQVLVGNEVRVHFVLRHLLNNAVKFTDQGRVSLVIDTVSDELRPGQHQVRIQVEDTGPGIPQSYLSRLDQPFNQLDGSFSRRHQGMGIGLATCCAVARLLDGALNVTNLPQGGLRVEFRFNHQVAAAPGSDTPSAVAATLQGTVLVVEDNKVNRLVLQGQLQRLGLQVVLAEDGSQALQRLGSQPVDLVLMDCQMPVMDGLAATRAIRESSSAQARVPVIALTANASEADRHQCLAAGMNGFLAKPVNMDSLRRELSIWL